MGLDNGFIVKSNRRKLTRAMLPENINYPFSEDYDGEIEIVYKRKCWGLRHDIMTTFAWNSENKTSFQIETPEKILILIELFARWLDEERWENEGSSIWEYKNIHDSLISDIINFAIIYTFMDKNPDIYLEFYDSY